MSDVEQEKKKDKEQADPARSRGLADYLFSDAMAYVRLVEQTLAMYNGNVPEEEKAKLKAQWLGFSGMSKILIQRELGSKLNQAIN